MQVLLTPNQAGCKSFKGKLLAMDDMWHPHIRIPILDSLAKRDYHESLGCEPMQPLWQCFMEEGSTMEQPSMAGGVARLDSERRFWAVKIEYYCVFFRMSPQEVLTSNGAMPQSHAKSRRCSKVTTR